MTLPTPIDFAALLKAVTDAQSADKTLRDQIAAAEAEMARVVEMKDTQITSLNDQIRLLKEQLASGGGGETPTAPFPIYDATRFPNNEAIDLPKIEVIYAGSFWPSGTDLTATLPPNLAYIKATTIPKFRAANPNVKRIAIDIENWPLGGTAAAQRLQWHIDVVNAIKQVWPGVEIGYYGEVPLRDLNHLTGTPELNASRLAEWRKDNDAAAPLVKAVSFLMPSGYLTLGSTRVTDPTLQVKYIADMVKEGLRIAQGKELILTVWIAWGSDHADVLSYDTMTRVLKAAKDAGANGVALWSMARNSPNFDPNAPWYRAAKAFK